MSLRRTIFPYLILMLLVSACRDEPSSVIGPEPPFQPTISPSKLFTSNGGIVPEAIPSTLGETRKDSISFEPTTYADDFDEVEGSQLGIWFGDQHIISEDPPTGNYSWTYCGEHSNWTGHSGARCIDSNDPGAFLYFYPPVRSVSFWYASDLRDADNYHLPEVPDDAFFYRATDTLGVTIAYDSIRANQDPPDSWLNGYPRDDWTRVLISSGEEDRIYRIFFDGYMIIDDLVIVREAPPAIVCDTVVRGSEPSTCRVRSEVLADLTSVTNWKNVVDLGSSGIDTVWGPASATEWSGEVAASGAVSAVGWINSDSVLLEGSLHVLDRSSSEWRWSGDDWDFVQGSAPDCPGLFPKFQMSTSPIIVGIHMHAKYCKNGYVDPPPSEDPLSTTVRKMISDAGPNDGLWYVDTASYRMDTGSKVNPSLFTTYVPLDNLHNKDKKECQKQGHTMQQANFYQFNELCRSADVDAWISGIWLHEGWGSTGYNGHESQLRVGAVLQENDPVAAVESLVDVSDQALISAITATIEIVDGDLDEVADDDHVFVRDNFPAMTFWLLDPGNGQFKSKVVDDVP